MSDRKRKTGLGTDAFFTPPRVEEPEEEKRLEKPAEGRVRQRLSSKTKKSSKVRTTITLYPEDLATLEELKIFEIRRRGKRVTYSDILADAINLLARERGIKA